ncbi:MAG: hypothetical protein CBD58_02130 [bacterium TMED198]|nr:MAG: hypothetical protein CBD58_02130 [bacterium TMED198]
MAMFSIVATETSVLTFVSIPSIAYMGDWYFMQLVLGFVVGRVIVSIFILPLYFKSKIVSIYQVLRERFDSSIQKLASGVFFITRILADSVRFLATAVIIEVITGWGMYSSLLIIASVTIVYSLIGGIKSIVYIDALQFGVYFLGGILCILFIVYTLDLKVLSIFSSLVSTPATLSSNKLDIVHFGNPLYASSSFVSAFIGGIFLSFASHGVDYMMVQRVIVTKSLTSARKALIGSGIFVLIQFAIFLFLGSLLWYYFEGLDLDLDIDRQLPYFIANYIPIGLKGLLVAGIISASMSTLSSSINSLSSTIIFDWFKEGQIDSIKVARMIGLACSLIIVAMSIYLYNVVDSALIIIGLKVASITYGSLSSLFILALFKKKFKINHIKISFIVSFLVSILWSQSSFSWTFIIPASILSFLCILFSIQNKNILYSLIVIFASIYFIKNDKDIYLSGLDVIKAENFNSLRNKNIALLINHTSLDKDGNHMIEILEDYPDIRIKVVFSPEHGLLGLGEAGEKIDSQAVKTPEVNLVSLYGKKRKPSKEDLEGVDILVVDIQDIGSRFYTYVSTIKNSINTAKELGVKVLILDRLNPLGGDIVAGSGMLDRYSSFVGSMSIPIRHGLTVGELFLLASSEGWMYDSKDDISVIKYKGLARSNMYNFIDRDWIATSPNIPNFEAAYLYTGLCLIEGTNVSEGRGTNKPFKLIGAPWIDSPKLLKSLRSYSLKGIQVKAVEFTPKSIIGKSTNPKYQNKVCNGIELQVLDYDIFDPIAFSIILIDELNKNFPDNFNFLESNFINNLYGSSRLKDAVLKGQGIKELLTSNEKDCNTFREIRSNYVIYK